MDLVWSDGLLEEACRTRDEVAAELAELGVPGELRLTGAAGTPGMLTKGDIDLHLRVPVGCFEEVVDLLGGAYPVGSPDAWAGTLAVFDLPRERQTGLAVTPVGSEHDVRFVTTWQRLAGDPSLRADHNRVKASAARTDAYEDLKSAFFDTVLDG